MTTIPSMPQSVPLFWGQNPLKIPLLCGFKRLTAGLLRSEGPELEDSQELMDSDVIYKTPCGLSLRNYDDVMSFLLETESYKILQVMQMLQHRRSGKVKTAPEKRLLKYF